MAMNPEEKVAYETKKDGYLNISAKQYYMDTMRPFMEDILLNCNSDEELLRTIEKTINAIDSFIMAEKYPEVIDELDYLNAPIADKVYFNSPRMKRATEEERLKIRDLISKIGEFKLILKYEKPSDKKSKSIRERLNYESPQDGSPNGENKDFLSHNMKELTKPIPRERIPNI